mmetsp:Transcript_62597/g.168210  ORF Transcript_62597/g.168210 Transcript_62597/m.168210 type:complete len:234 (-) Transcript_62597:324-1025(-)
MAIVCRVSTACCHLPTAHHTRQRASQKQLVVRGGVIVSGSNAVRRPDPTFPRRALRSSSGLLRSRIATGIALRFGLRPTALEQGSPGPWPVLTRGRIQGLPTETLRFRGRSRPLLCPAVVVEPLSIVVDLQLFIGLRVRRQQLLPQLHESIVLLETRHTSCTRLVASSGRPRPSASSRRRGRRATTAATSFSGLLPEPPASGPGNFLFIATHAREVADDRALGGAAFGTTALA